jgi:hypothetical protein
VCSREKDGFLAITDTEVALVATPNASPATLRSVWQKFFAIVFCLKSGINSNANGQVRGAASS